MKFNLFRKKLPDIVERERLLEELRNAEGHLLETTLPAYESVESLMKGWTAKNSTVKEVDQIILRDIEKTTRSSNLFVIIHAGLDKNVRENIQYLENYIIKHLNDKVLADGMTFVTANIIQLIEMISFTIHYARRYLDFMMTMESIEYDNQGLGTKDTISKAEIEWIKQNAHNFAIAFNSATRERSNTDKMLEKIPQISIVDDNEDLLAKTVGINKLDPFNMRFLPLAIHPFYIWGMFWAEIEAERRKAAIEELKRIQARKLHLENLKSGTNDPRIEKEIIGITNRIQTLNSRIQKIEAKADQ